MNRVTELKEKNVEGEVLFLIAECNEYDEINNLNQQLSRTPFAYPSTMTDDEIIADINEKYYNIYF